MDYLGRPFYMLTGGGGGSGGGDVVGPPTSTVNAVARFAGIDGNEIKNSTATISDTGVMTVAAVATDFVTSTGSMIVEGVTDCVVRATAGSSIEVSTDVVIDTDGTVSLTGRASPTAVAISGDTVLTGTLTTTGSIAVPRIYNSLTLITNVINMNSSGNLALNSFNSVLVTGNAGLALSGGLVTINGTSVDPLATPIIFSGKSRFNNNLTVNGDFATVGGVRFDFGSVLVNGSSCSIVPTGTCSIQPTGLLTINPFTCVGQITMNGTSKITNLGTPTLPADAATKAYVDARNPFAYRIRVPNSPDRPPVVGTAVYSDEYIRLGWQSPSVNDLQIQRTSLASEYICSSFHNGSNLNTTINVVSVDTTYVLNTFNFTGGEVCDIRISPVASDVIPSYQISVHYTENSIGTDGALDFTILRFNP